MTGIGAGDCVAIFLRNDLPFLIVSRAAGWVGAYAVPVNWHLAGPELTYILEDSDAKLLVIHADLWHRVHANLPADLNCLIVETPEDLIQAYDLDRATCGVPIGQFD